MNKINLLNEFFNSRSDASTLEANEQEKLEKEFEDWFEEKLKDFDFVAKMAVKHIDENYHPHTVMTVEGDRAVMWEGLKCYVNPQYIRD